MQMLLPPPSVGLEMGQEMQVKSERTGWRDQSLSLRHRKWGYNCPAVDIDFLMIEYDLGIPAALVEYKHEGYNMGLMSQSAWNAFRVLCDNRIPLLKVVYADDLTWYEVQPMNDRAREFVSETIMLSEHQYVALLYDIRGRPMPMFAVPLAGGGNL